VRLVPALLVLLLLAHSSLAENQAPEILGFSPTSGPEGTRIEIAGTHLQLVTSVLVGTSSSAFKLISQEKLIAIVPHRAGTAKIAVLTSDTRTESPFPFVVTNDPRIPDEVSYKAGYVNVQAAPPGFSSVMLWGIALADTRVPGYESATVEIARTQLVCRIDAQDELLIEDTGKVRGGLYRRIPWFAGNESEPMPLSDDPEKPTVLLRVGQQPNRAWHFWSASPRPLLREGKLEGCTVKVLVRISEGALLQIGMDYWRNSTVPYAPGNNHEAGASNWYFPSGRWQEAVFTDIGGPSF
jgi:hypothetical protein